MLQYRVGVCGWWAHVSMKARQDSGKSEIVNLIVPPWGQTREGSFPLRKKLTAPDVVKNRWSRESGGSFYRFRAGH